MSVLVLEKPATDWFVTRNFPTGPGMKIVTITPEDAADLLLTNDDNRTISEGKVNQYAADMKAGNWVMNGETIKVSRDGYLNDGQHRLQAVIKAGVPIETAFIFGVERDSRLTVDQGRSRGAGCYLGLKGVANSNQVAAIARLMIAFEKTKGASVSIHPTPTNAQVLAYVDKYSNELQASIHFTNKMPKSSKNIASRTMFSFWAFLFRKNPQALDYIDQIMTGMNIASVDAPAHRVREKLTSLTRSSKQASTEAFLRGWAFQREGKTMTHIKLVGHLPKI